MVKKSNVDANISKINYILFKYFKLKNFFLYYQQYLF